MNILSKVKKRLTDGRPSNQGILGQVPINETQDDDIFIIGFPKSGNTWMQHIVSHLYYHLNFNQSRALVNLITPDVYANSTYLRLNKVCFFKSHDLPQERYKNVIYIMRDGRDALLSYYHMHKNMGKDVLLEDFFGEGAKISPCKWHEHIEAWLDNPYKANILFVKYEDLKSHNLETIKEIASFIKAPDTSDKFIEYVSNETSFKSMRDLESRDDFWKKGKESSNFKSDTYFVRKGEIQAYKEEVPAHLIQEFNRYSKKYLLHFDYDL